MRNNKGFTLVEILIVVIILGILAAIVIPQFSNASANARASMLADNLRIMRTQVMVFKAQHNSVSPGYPGGDPTGPPTETAFIAHITQASKPTCETDVPGTAGFPYGPYMTKIPENPINGSTRVVIVPDGQAFPGAPSGAGWVYQPSTLIFKCDASGADENGRSYFDY
jgi:prepilin-type N-terminal cleavage/methylation domain-containing protein